MLGTPAYEQIAALDAAARPSAGELARMGYQARLCPYGVYSTVTDLARFRAWSTLHPRIRAIW